MSHSNKPSKQAMSLVDTAMDIWGENAATRDGGAHLGFVHAINSQVYFPRRKLPQRDYEHRVGSAILSISAGKLINPVTSELELQAVPYGAKPRLLQTYINTMAIKLQSRDIPLFDSFTSFIKSIDGEARGGARGNIQQWKTQLGAFSAADIKYGFSAEEGHIRLRNFQIVEELQLWSTTNPDQRFIWPEHLVLNERYFNDLMKHSLPIDMKGLRQLAASTLSYDIHLWLAYRLHRITDANGVLITWSALREQFSPEYKQLHKFKAKFLDALAKAIAIYQDARHAIDVEDAGLRIKFAQPPIQKKLKLIKR